MDEKWITDFYEHGSLFGYAGFAQSGIRGCIPCANFFHKLWQTMKLINSETPRTPVLASFIFMVALYYYAIYDVTNPVIRKIRGVRRRLKRNFLGLALSCLLNGVEVLCVIILPLFSYYTTWIPANKAAYYVADHTNSEFWLKTLALAVSMATFGLARKNIKQQKVEYQDHHKNEGSRRHKPRGTWYSKSRR